MRGDTERGASPPRRLERSWFSVDTRSAGLFRILVAVVLIVQWIDRWGWIDRLYTASGVMPAETVGRLVGWTHRLSPLALPWIDADPWRVRGVFLLVLACYALLLVGFRTRVAAALSLAAFIFVSQRNPFLLIGADHVLAAMLLWMQVLPVGQRFSIDACLRARAGSAPPPVERSIAAFGIVLHLGLLYLFAALWKRGDAWLDGTAFHYVLQMEQFVRLPAVWLRAAGPPWIAVVTYASLIAELVALPLMLLPWGGSWPRRVALLLLVPLHAGIALTLDVGVFSLAMIASLSILLSTDDWSAFARWAPALGAPASPAGWAPSRARDAFSAVILASLVLSVAIENVVLPLRGPALDAPWRTVERLNLPIRVLAAPQRWTMFAPDPPPYDHWWVVVATADDGSRVDPLTGRPPTFEQPSWREHRFDSTWGAYLTRAVSPDSPSSRNQTALVRLELCRWLARLVGGADVDAGNSTTPTTIEVYHVRRHTPPPGRESRYATDRHRLAAYEPGTERFHAGDPYRTVREWYVPGPDRTPVLVARGPRHVMTGRRDGSWSGWYEDGKPKWNGEFRNGTQSGGWTEWSDEGWVASGPMEDGKRHGVWTYRYPDGSVAAGPYRRGIQGGIWERFDPEGRLRNRSTLVDGVRQGPSASYFPDDAGAPVGVVSRRGRFEAGREHGPWTFWYPNGRKKMEGAFRNGERDGAWTFWHPDGRLRHHAVYRDGVELTETGSP